MRALESRKPEEHRACSVSKAALREVDKAKEIGMQDKNQRWIMASRTRALLVIQTGLAQRMSSVGRTQEEVMVELRKLSVEERG